MGFYKDSNKSELPDMQVAISYSVLYNDYDKVDPTLFIKDIPTLAILNFVVELQNKVLFAISDVTTQRCMIHEMCKWLDREARKKAWHFLQRHKLPLLMSCDTSFLMFQLALSNYVPFESDDNDLKSATKLFSVLLASKRPLITELADKLRLKYPLLPTISPCPTMRLEAIRSIIPISCRRYPKSV